MDSLEPDGSPTPKVHSVLLQRPKIRGDPALRLQRYLLSLPVAVYFLDQRVRSS